MPAEPMMFVCLPVRSLPAVLAALRAADFSGTAVDVEHAARDFTDPEQNKARLGWIAKATEQAVDGDTIFYDDSVVSSVDDKVYVMGWTKLMDE